MINFRKLTSADESVDVQVVWVIIRHQVELPGDETGCGLKKR